MFLSFGVRKVCLPLHRMNARNRSCNCDLKVVLELHRLTEEGGDHCHSDASRSCAASPPGSGCVPSVSHSYKKGSGVDADKSVLEAKFSGNYGWYWRNRGKGNVVVTLRTSGAYSAINRVLQGQTQVTVVADRLTIARPSSESKKDRCFRCGCEAGVMSARNSRRKVEKKG